VRVIDAFYLAVFMLFTFPSAAMEAVPKLPVAAFARLPELQGIQLSPDGEKVAGLLNIDGDTILVARNVAADKLIPVVKTDNRQIAVNWFRWANNERILVSIRFPDRRYGVATMETRLMSVRYDGSKLINVAGGSKNNPYWISQLQDRVVDWLPDDPDHILIAADLETQLMLDVYQVDVNNGARKRLRAPSQANVRKWITDRQHRVRVGVKLEDTTWEVMFCDADQKKWRVGWSYANFSDKEIMPIGFGEDPNILYVSAYHEGRQAIFTVDLTDPALPLQLKYASSRYDVDDELVYSQKAGDYIGVIDSGSDGSYVFWLQRRRNALPTFLQRQQTSRRLLLRRSQYRNGGADRLNVSAVACRRSGR
jgi:hypothetical protein